MREVILIGAGIVIGYAINKVSRDNRDLKKALDAAIASKNK